MCTFKNKGVSHVLFLLLVAVFSLVSVSAAESSEDSDQSPVDAVVEVDIPIVAENQTVVQPIVVQVDPPDPGEIISALGDLLLPSDPVAAPVDDDGDALELVGVTAYDVSPLYELDNGASSSATGLKGIIRNLIGDYNAVVVQFQYRANTSTNYSYVNQIQPDYEWLCSCGIFALMIFCTFRLGGALLRKV